MSFGEKGSRVPLQEGKGSGPSVFKLHGHPSVHLSMKIEYGLHYDVQNDTNQKPVSFGFEGSSDIGKGLGTYDLGLLRDACR